MIDKNQPTTPVEPEDLIRRRATEEPDAEGHRFRGGFTEDAPEAEGVAKVDDGTPEPDEAGRVKF